MSEDSDISICIIGAGLSGVCAGVQLKKLLNIKNFKIIERNPDFGGVWFTNTYPGCACDISSHLYSFSFEPNPGWSKSFAPQQEILEYIRSVATKYDLYSNALFNHRVISIVWNKNLLKWQVTLIESANGVEQEREMLFNIVINGQGRFNTPKIPDQFKNFKNPIIHSGKWNHSIQLEGKRVAVIGTGSTAAQLIPCVAERTKHLLVYQRHAMYIFPVEHIDYSPIVRWCFANIPFVQWFYRIYLYRQYEKFISAFRLNTEMNLGAKAFAQGYIQQQITDVDLQAKLLPDYPFGCKRVIPSNDLYPAFNRSNVEVITSPIAEIKEGSLVTKDGDEKQIDILVLATGFQVQDFYGSFKLIGCDGVDVHKVWKDNAPKAYLGIMSSYAPNYFILLGPNTAPGYTSFAFALECQVLWIVEVIKRMISMRSKYVSIKSAVEDSYMKEIQEKMATTIYAHPQCGESGSWLQNSRGVVAEVYPDSTYSYWRRTSQLNIRDFEFHANC